MLHSVFQLIKSIWEQLKEQQALSKPDPSQWYFEALGFLNCGYAVIPLVQENKRGDIYIWKNRWLISENSLILSLAEDNLPHICINIANVYTKLHWPVTLFGLCVWPQPPAAGEQERGHTQFCWPWFLLFCLKSGRGLLLALNLPGSDLTCWVELGLFFLALKWKKMMFDRSLTSAHMHWSVDNDVNSFLYYCWT